MLADRDAGAVQQVCNGFAGQFGKDVVRAVACDVTDEAQVQAAFAYAAREFGGLDVLVANAGIASSAAAIVSCTSSAVRRKAAGGSRCAATSAARCAAPRVWSST